VPRFRTSSVLPDRHYRAGRRTYRSRSSHLFNLPRAGVMSSVRPRDKPGVWGLGWLCRRRPSTTPQAVARRTPASQSLKVIAGRLAQLPADFARLAPGPTALPNPGTTSVQTRMIFRPRSNRRRSAGAGLTAGRLWPSGSSTAPTTRTGDYLDLDRAEGSTSAKQTPVGRGWLNCRPTLAVWLLDGAHHPNRGLLRSRPG
jgi:hypothetical protein